MGVAPTLILTGNLQFIVVQHIGRNWSVLMHYILFCLSSGPASSESSTSESSNGGSCSAPSGGNSDTSMSSVLEKIESLMEAVKNIDTSIDKMETLVCLQRIIPDFNFDLLEYFHACLFSIGSKHND